MAIAFIPAVLQDSTDGKFAIEVGGTTVGQVIENLEIALPGIRERLVERDRLRPNIRVAVDGRLSSIGLLERVSPSSEVHFIPAATGG